MTALQQKVPDEARGLLRFAVWLCRYVFAVVVFAAARAQFDFDPGWPMLLLILAVPALALVPLRLTEDRRPSSQNITVNVTGNELRDPRRVAARIESDMRRFGGAK